MSVYRPSGCVDGVDDVCDARLFGAALYCFKYPRACVQAVGVTGFCDLADDVVEASAVCDGVVEGARCGWSTNSVSRVATLVLCSFDSDRAAEFVFVEHAGVVEDARVVSERGSVWEVGVVDDSVECFEVLTACLLVCGGEEEGLFWFEVDGLQGLGECVFCVVGEPGFVDGVDEVVSSAGDGVDALCVLVGGEASNPVVDLALAEAVFSFSVLGDVFVVALGVFPSIT